MISPLMISTLLVKQPQRGNCIFKLCKLWARIWHKAVGIRYEQISEQPWEASKQYVYVANHQSYLDVVSLVCFIDRPTRILGRRDITQIPIIGFFYKQVVVTVDRNNLRDKVDSLKSLNKSIQDDLSVFVFPEGTFNESEQPLDDFYDGAFKIALDTKTTIKPILFLDNAQRLNPESFLSLTPGPSRTIILADIEIDNYQRRDVKKLKTYVHERMRDGVLKYRR